ncbi:MAG: hypothetical protein IZT55_02425 [Anaerolineae bacterium]|nr:hypothetical protein [Anaerolineae bacterium]
MWRFSLEIPSHLSLIAVFIDKLIDPKLQQVRDTQRSVDPNDKKQQITEVPLTSK